MIERKFIQEAVRRMNASAYLKRELDKAGVVDVNIQRTTLATRINLMAERPGLIIGKKGKNIKDLADAVAKQLGVENPQIEVTEVPNPALEPVVVGKWIRQALERGFKGKRVLQRAIERVMDSGAIGCEIIIKGTPSKGSIAKKDRVQAGYLKKSGESSKQVRVAKETVVLKQGAMGIQVRIVPPDAVFMDKIDIEKAKMAAVAAPVPAAALGAAGPVVAQASAAAAQPVEGKVAGAKPGRGRARKKKPEESTPAGGEEPVAVAASAPAAAPVPEPAVEVKQEG